MYTVDLNSDLGESFGNYKIGNDDKIIPLISSANVACGYHASDPVCALSAGCTGCILQSNRCKNAACKASWSLI